MESKIPQGLINTLAIYGLSSLIAGLAQLPAKKMQQVKEMIEDKDILGLEDFEKKEFKQSEQKQEEQKPQQEQDKKQDDGEDDKQRKEYERLKKLYEPDEQMKHYKGDN